jgi:hypothetical protein
MKLSDALIGIQTLQPFYDKPNGHHLGAEHDQIYLYPTNRPLTPEAEATMREAGWFQPDARPVEDADNSNTAPYDPGEGWSAFT